MKIRYLYESIFAVYSAIIGLTQDLNILFKLFCLGHAHDASPLIVDLNPIHVTIGLFLLLPFNQPQPADRGTFLSFN